MSEWLGNWEHWSGVSRETCDGSLRLQTCRYCFPHKFCEQRPRVHHYIQNYQGTSNRLVECIRTCFLAVNNMSLAFDAKL